MTVGAPVRPVRAPTRTMALDVRIEILRGSSGPEGLWRGASSSSIVGQHRYPIYPYSPDRLRPCTALLQLITHRRSTRTQQAADRTHKAGSCAPRYPPQPRADRTGRRARGTMQKRPESRGPPRCGMRSGWWYCRAETRLIPHRSDGQ